MVLMSLISAIKRSLKGWFFSYLFDQGVLHKCEPEMELAPGSESAPAVMDAVGLTIEQRKELLLQHEQERMQKRLGLERLRQDTKRMKLELERSRLQLIQEGKVTPAGLGVNSGVSGLSGGEGAANLQLLPKFNERDPDIFFTLFECVADAQK